MAPKTTNLRPLDKTEGEMLSRIFLSSDPALGELLLAVQERCARKLEEEAKQLREPDAYYVMVDEMADHYDSAAETIRSLRFGDVFGGK
jgi:hypothetical protein